ncbi:MAG: murein biosynthesis integral membrane protein MurJ [Candidatus Pacebacteria bacterium RIFOXYB1_FULL_39_46]|nr:MAG: murein biosynthesis integral membrane protein MurJ [Candidatus Pacebacteria bacterium RIFOXYA1_FULL_38_18]OGJ38128.1 MAG: murein biosynthesis integral membrane protein MurJ [Candidatus Pacebacteria bacterium RIFOXYB1_FULL_39_46]OGJ39650.1 MAG: murein biosynthesis integral membrane protein MurJ [Candidatus Pacebacteria bacterium RIFOXYC1_FULL_39_21]OGJ39880.1 MAG: murein biosynthesis integral membrane protein MurJ [Candidatus Pacebacteria bacterium RIFOXYD1_FULL_39_27]
MILKLSQFFSNNGKWLEKKQTSILSAALIITIANIASSLAGLLRERLLISSFFDSIETQLAYEAFQVAFQIPDMLFQLVILGAVAASFIPLFTDLKKSSEEEAFRFTSSVMNLLLLIFIIFSLIIGIFAYPLTEWRTGAAFTPEQVGITVGLTRLMLFAQLFFAVSNFLTGMLQSYRRFIIPAIAPVLYNFGIILGVYLFKSSFGIYSAGLGVILGAFLHMIMQVPLAWKMGFRPKLIIDFKSVALRKLFRMMPPRVLTIGISELQNLGLGFFATTIGGLSFVVIRLGMRLMTIPIRLFGVPISQASLPFLAQETGEEEHQRFNSLVIQSLHQISFFALPASALLLILRIPIVRLIFGADNFPWQTTLSTGRVVAILAFSVAAQAMTQLLVRTFYALKNTKTPLYITLAASSLFFTISALAVAYTSWGVLGLAFSLLISAFIELILFIITLQKKLHCFTFRDFWWPQIKMISSSFLMAVFLYLPFKILDELVFDTTRTLELVALTLSTSTIGMLVYIYFSMLFEVKELNYLNKLFSTMTRWRQFLASSKEVLVETSADGNEM